MLSGWIEIMTEDEFRILEQRMAANRGDIKEYLDSLTVNSKPDVDWPEHMIEAECTRLLEQDGWRALRTDPVSDRGRGKGFGEKGMADHLYIRYGNATCGVATDGSNDVVMWIEFKSAKGKPAKHQTEWHTKERARGALTLIAGEDFPASVAGFVEWYRKSGLNRGRV